MSVMNYKCPACGAPLTYKGDTGNMTCEYCGSSFTMEEAKAAEEAEKKDAASSDMTFAEPDLKPITDEEGQLQGYSCPSCGAEIVADESTASTECPYCGNQAIIPKAFEGTFRPDTMIPFKVDKKQAQSALDNFYKGKKLLPNSFMKGNKIKEIQGVYVPFWLMSCTADGSVSFDAEKRTRWSDSDSEYVKTDYYAVYRSGEMAFNRIPVDASKSMDDATMDALEPFDYSALTGYESAYFSGYLANRYDVEIKDCEPRLIKRVTQTFVDEMRDTVKGYDSVSRKGDNVTIKGTETEYAMLPVWMLGTKYEGKRYSFAMNGQTGKVVGSLPVDMGKYWKYMLIATLIGLIICTLILFLFSGDQGPGAIGYIIDLVISIIIGFLYANHLKGQMDNVKMQEQAAAYLNGSSIVIRERKDQYLRSHTNVTKKQNSD